MHHVFRHAGYTYSGATAAYGFNELKQVASRVKRVFILGPSHHHYTTACQLSPFSTYNSPLGDLTVDVDGE